MLTTLIYRSQLNLSRPSTELRELVERARIRNASLNITGVLLAKGSDVLQILEGSEESVLKLFHKIRDDKRHSGVVELMRDYGPRRRFEHVGMLLFDLQTQSPKEVLQSVLNYSKLESYLTSDDRVFKFIQTFITGKRPALSGARYVPEKWTLSSEALPFGEHLGLMANQTCQFALQPIVEPRKGRSVRLKPSFAATKAAARSISSAPLTRTKSTKSISRRKRMPLLSRKSWALAAIRLR
ncbi:hypothetical protein A0R60_0810 [Enterobacter asburiae]|nr:hypothetical protein A0R60_0810 [Enterobacter asburiae]